MPGTVMSGYPASSLLWGFQRFLSSAYLFISEFDTTFYTTYFFNRKDTIRFSLMMPFRSHRSVMIYDQIRVDS